MEVDDERPEELPEAARGATSDGLRESSRVMETMVRIAPA